MSENNDKNTNISENELHYKSLISFFSRILGITGSVISLIILIVGVLFYQDRNQMKADLKELKQESLKAIGSTKENADKQINQIRSHAEDVAISEARNRVKIAFKEHNVDEMIGLAVKDIVMKSIQDSLKSEISKTSIKIDNDLNNISRIHDAAMQMRMASRSGLDEFLKLNNTLQDSFLLNISHVLFQKISDKYENDYKIKIQPDTSKFKVDKETISWQPNLGDIPDLINNINSNEYLEIVAEAFIILRYKTGVNFEMFNIDQVNKWWKVNKLKYDINK